MLSSNCGTTGCSPRSRAGQIGLLNPHMATEHLPRGAGVLEAGEEFDHVYFLHSGMLC